VRQKLEALRIWRLTEELNLTEDQSAQFFPKLRKMREVREAHHENRRAVLADLAEALRSDSSDAKRLRQLMDSLAALDDNLRTAEQKSRQELNELLSVEQQARLILFQADFDRQTRRMIQQIQKERGHPRKGR
jgi:Spy/CpxP family protein refolding chaperone